MSYKTVNRGWLKRQIQAGNVRAKCDFHYTDDYAWDGAVNFQRTDWMPAYFNPPQVWEEITLPNGNKSHRCTNNHERNPQGYISFNDHDLDSTSGRAHWDEDGKTIDLSVHSNLSFSLQLVKLVKSDGTHKKAKAPANTPKAGLARLAAKIQADTNDYYTRKYANVPAPQVKIVTGKKYTKVDVGTSGRYMVENETGRIYGIKGYGVIHRGHYYGTLETIDQYYWGDYRAYKVATPKAAPAPTRRPANRFEGFYLEEQN